MRASRSTSEPQRETVHASAKPAKRRTNLVLGALDDRREDEAHRASETVMGVPETRPLRDVAASEPGPASVPPIVADVLATPGDALDTSAREFMEARFDRDFTGVRVHTDPLAHQSAEAVGARAYTVGVDIVFGPAQYAPTTPGGRSLLAHELAHTAQGGTPTLRRQPTVAKKRTEPVRKPAERQYEIRLKPRPNELAIEFSDILFEKDVLPVLFKNGKLPDGFTLAGSAGGSVTTRWDLTVPTGRDFSKAQALLDERFVTQLSAKRAEQVALEKKTSAETYESTVKEARARFRKRHSGHSATVLDNIDAALERVTQNNPNLLVAYYDYYADAQLTDELESASEAGETVSGDTDLNPDVLKLRSSFPTKDPLSLLGGTLIHEYVHTPQGGKTHSIERALREAKAYAIEVFLAERMGDDARAAVIYRRYTNDSVDMGSGADKIFNDTYNTIRALYEIIDSGRTQSDARIAGDISAEEARRMSVEFIGHTEEYWSDALKQFIKSNRFR
jgi:uncharacterized protein DUF4157